MCDACIDTMTRLTAHPRYEVREVAAWVVREAPTYHKLMADQFAASLSGVRRPRCGNAADFLGASTTFRASPQLRAAIRRSLDSDAKLAIVRAVDALGNLGGNDVLTVAMADGDATVRAAAVRAWRDIRGQKDAAPIVAMLGDADIAGLAEAATVVGGLKQASATGAGDAVVLIRARLQERGVGPRQDRRELVAHRAGLASNDASGPCA
jgi:hypothetical protein